MAIPINVIPATTNKTKCLTFLPLYKSRNTNIMPNQLTRFCFVKNPRAGKIDIKRIFFQLGDLIYKSNAKKLKLDTSTARESEWRAWANLFTLGDVPAKNKAKNVSISQVLGNGILWLGLDSLLSNNEVIVATIALQNTKNSWITRQNSMDVDLPMIQEIE